MDLQLLIVTLIVFAAAALVGRAALTRIRSFKGKSSCATDCGCSGKSKKASI